MSISKFAEVHNMVAFLSNPTKMKNINGKAQLHAKVDEKKVVISEASIRRDLQFEDEGGVDCLPNEKPRKTKRNDTQVPQLSVPTESVADKAINEEMDDNMEITNESSSHGTDSGGSPRCQEAMGDTVAQTRSERVSKIYNDPLLAKVNTPQSGEESLKINELMELCTDLQNKLEKKQRSRTHKLKRLYKVRLSARVKSSDDEGLEIFDADKDLQGEEVVVEQEVVANKEPIVDDAQDHEEPSESRRTTTISSKESHDKGKDKMIEEPMKLKKKDQILFDEEVARKLQEEINKEERLRKGERTELVGESSMKVKEEITQEESLKRAGDELEQETAKKQKIVNDNETTNLKQLVKIIPEEDIAVDAIPLAVKTLIKVRPVWNNARRVNHQNFSKMTQPHPKRSFVPTAVATKSEQVLINFAKQTSSSSTSTARPKVNTAAIRPNVNAKSSYFKPHSFKRRNFNQKSTAKTNTFSRKINTAKGKNVATTRQKAVVNAAERKKENARNLQYTLQDQGIFNSVCSRHMTSNKSFLTKYQEIDGGFVAFGGSPKGGKITRKGKIRTGKLDFEDVYFVKELNFNLFSVSQIARMLMLMTYQGYVNTGDIQGDVNEISRNDDVCQGNAFKIDSSTQAVNAASSSIVGSNNYHSYGYMIKIRSRESRHGKEKFN
uniref:Retrovirus-related Pol polyprotein from transposon TNT 1-94-like beta-barrel domain-containing protein n=1 Tax=Tanacetum cinerariifolium TaxID=118510 RepID=A0A699GNC2_TANCI|nr:hypothetical protein [Tanacetum cinerariifolium]